MATFCGRITVCGKPNVGKSTLLNLLLKEKLFIVSPKPQTTRHAILGILSENPYQIIFSDTPGIIKTPKYKMQSIMETHRKKSIDDSDLILWIVFPEQTPEENEEILYHSFKKKKVILAINKIDTIKDKSSILPLIKSYESMGIKDIFPISALKETGIEELKKCIFNNIPESPFLYPEDYISKHPERFFVSEIIREKIFNLFEKEIPYSSAVRVEEMQTRPNGKIYIRSIIIVERDSQKKILIGAGGRGVKKIGSDARKDIELFLDKSVYLDLNIKTVKNWRKKFNLDSLMDPDKYI